MFGASGWVATVVKFHRDYQTQGMDVHELYAGHYKRLLQLGMEQLPEEFVPFWSTALEKGSYPDQIGTF